MYIEEENAIAKALLKNKIKDTGLSLLNIDNYTKV